MSQEDIVQVFIPLGNRLSKIESRDDLINYTGSLSNQEYEDHLLYWGNFMEALLLSLNRFLPEDVNPILSLYQVRINNQLSDINRLLKKENIYGKDRLELTKTELITYQNHLSKYLHINNLKKPISESISGTVHTTKFSQPLKQPIVLSNDFTLGQISDSGFEPKLSNFQAAFLLNSLQQLEILPHYPGTDIKKIAELLFCRNGKNVTQKKNALKNTQKGEIDQLIELLELLKGINVIAYERIKMLNDKKNSNL